MTVPVIAVAQSEPQVPARSFPAGPVTGLEHRQAHDPSRSLLAKF